MTTILDFLVATWPGLIFIAIALVGLIFVVIGLFDLFKVFA